MTTYYIDVPARGRKWVHGAIVREGNVLYHVTGRPERYHEDCPPRQRVTRLDAADIPANFAAAQRLLEIMSYVRTAGTHIPFSRGDVPDRPTAPIPSGTSRAEWTAREESRSYASFPSLRIIDDDILVFNEPIYDDSPVVVWLRNAALAIEAKQLISRSPRLDRYPRVSVHQR